MSEFNAVYRRNRTKWICILGAAVLLLTFAVIFCAVPLLSSADNGKSLEQGNVEYRVSLNDNNFYQTESANGGQAYIGELIENISAEFDYTLILDGGLLCKCIYDIRAYVEIRDAATDVVILQSEHGVIPERAVESSDGKINVSETVDIDYGEYDRIARDFVSRYSPERTENKLKVVMKIRAVEAYGKEINDRAGYEEILSVPLGVNTVIPTVTTDGTVRDRIHTAANDGGVRGARIILLSAFALFDALSITALVLFVTMTSDGGVRKARRTRRLMSEYNGYIQRARNKFNTSGYQIMQMDSLIDMIEISEKLNSPLVSYEDRDKNKTCFYVIAEPSVLYTFEFDGAGYDDTDRLTVTHWNYSENGRTDNLKQKLRRFLNN